MKNYQLLKDLVPKAHHSKNGFDRSTRELFSMKAGMLLPVKCIETVPDGYYELDIAALARTLPMVSAPYTQMKLYFDTFFVPYSQLWHGWDSWRAQRDNYDTSYHQGTSYIPMLDLYKFWHDISFCYDGNSEQWYDRQPDLPQDCPTDVFDHSIAPAAVRLAGLLGYGGFSGSVSAEKLLSMYENNYGRYANVWRIAAYQKIFQDHYMNPYYQLPNPFYYNFDDIDCSTPELAVISNVNASKATSYSVPTGADPWIPRMVSQNSMPEVNLFMPRYRRWKQDLFMGLLPNPQFGEVSMMPGTDFTLNVRLENGNDISTTNVLKSATNGRVNLATSASATTQNAVFSVDNLISVLDERRAKALQKWKETTMRAGFRARSQAIAHDGVAPVHSNDNRVVFLGSSSQVISIDEVVAQAQTGTGEGQSLGDIAGKGITAMNGEKIRYEATEFGIIMTIASIEPMCLYTDAGVSAFNTKVEHFDYYTQEVESLGFAPVPWSHLNGFVPMGEASEDNPIAGYAPRYWEYKTDIDRVHGEFGFDGSLASWTIMRHDLVNYGFSGVTIPEFYINPSIVDSIFGVNSNLNENTDQFWLTCVFDVKAVQPMSVLGLPY